MVALLCDGNVLIEDVLVTGITMLTRAIALSLGGKFKRLQCTPDLLAIDVTGYQFTIQFHQQMTAVIYSEFWKLKDGCR